MADRTDGDPAAGVDPWGGVQSVGEAEHPLLRTKLVRVRSDLFGTMWAPRTFGELTAVVESLTRREMIAWRGQADQKWRLDCAALRRLFGVRDWDIKLRPNSSTLRLALDKYEEALIHEARLAGHGHRDGRRLHELELLSILQHHGAATRLLDFTRNVFVAAWFASYEKPQETGIVLGLERGEVKVIDDYNEARSSVQDLLFVGPEDTDRVLFWEPPPLFPRMMAQQSCFVFSNPVGDSWGSLPLPDFGDEDENFATVRIAILPQLKRDMRDWWRKAFGFGVKALFPEVEGFSRHHSAERELEFSFVKRIKEAGV